MNITVTNLVGVPDIAGQEVDFAAQENHLAISEMSQKFEVTLRTLRFYEEKGLLKPVRKGARRFYSARDVGRMRVILQAKKIGLTLVEIRRVIALVEGNAPRSEQFAELREICKGQHELLLEQKQMLDEQIAEVEDIVTAFNKLI